MSTIGNAAVLIALVGAGALAGRLYDRSGSDSQPAAQQTSSQSPAPPAVADSKMEIVSFLQRVRPLHETARRVCDGAYKCTIVWAPGAVPGGARPGDVTDIVDVLPCLDVRIPECELTINDLMKFAPPPAARPDLWRGFVRNDTVSLLNEARVTRDMLAAMKRLPRLSYAKRFNRDWITMASWASEHSPEDAARYRAAVQEGEPDRLAWIAYNDWIETLGLCAIGTNCGVKRVMRAQGLKPQYTSAARSTF
jgi:hypothetical protein